MKFRLRWFLLSQEVYSKDNFESKEDFYHLDDFIEVLKKYSSLEISY